MNIMPMGDYYVWHCDWCDSRNATLWTRIDDRFITCTACLHSYTVGEGGELSSAHKETYREAV